MDLLQAAWGIWELEEEKYALLRRGRWAASAEEKEVEAEMTGMLQDEGKGNGRG